MDPADPDTAISRYERHVIPFNYGSESVLSSVAISGEVPQIPTESYLPSFTHHWFAQGSRLYHFGNLVAGVGLAPTTFWL